MSSDVRPRVLHVVDTFGAISETFIYRYAVGSATYEAAVVCRRWEHRDAFPHPHVQIVHDPYSRCSPWHWISTGALALTGRSLWHRGIAHAIQRWRPAVVHAHFGHVGASVLPALAGAAPPLVTSFYGFDASVLGIDPAWRPRYDALFSRGAAFLAEGPVLRDRLVAMGAPAARTHLQRIAIDTGAMPPWQRPPRPRALFVGRLVEKKGLADAVRAWARARTQMPELTLDVIGDGPERATVAALARALGVEHAVAFLGFRPYSDVIEALRTSSVLIHPSVTARNGDSEGGAPTVLIEAQAIGIPIVTTRHADIPYVTGGGGVGIWLCDEHDVPVLAEALIAAVRRGEASSPAHVRAYHDIATEVIRLETLYRRVCGQEA